MISLSNIATSTFLPRRPLQPFLPVATPLRLPAIPMIKISTRAMFVSARRGSGNKFDDADEGEEEDSVSDTDEPDKMSKANQEVLVMLKESVAGSYMRKIGRDARALYLHYLKSEKPSDELEKQAERYHSTIDSAMVALRGSKGGGRMDSQYDETLILKVFLEAFLDAPPSPDPAGELKRRFPNVRDKVREGFLQFRDSAEVTYMGAADGKEEDDDDEEEGDGKDGGRGEVPSAND